MAKINWNDYQKSKKKQEPVFESDEALIRRARTRLESDPLVVSASYRVANLAAAVQILSQVEDDREAKKLREECLEKVKEAKLLEREDRYRRAKIHLSEAEEENEFVKASGEFASLAGYKDSDACKSRADAQVHRYHVRYNVKRSVVLAVFLSLAGLVFAGFQTGYTRYLAAKMEGMAGIYQSSYSRFYKLGDFLDSREQYRYYKDKYLRQREKTEQLSLPDAKSGDEVKFGEYTWVVLDKKNTTLELLCLNPELSDESAVQVLANLPFNQTAQDTVWETSTLRKYLNGGAMDLMFTDLEQEAMQEMTYMPSANEKYGEGAALQTLPEGAEGKADVQAAEAGTGSTGTSGGSASLTDKIRLLDAQEAHMYADSDIYKSLKADTWLTTAGHDGLSASYMTTDGTVIDYGNDITDDSISACPVIVVNYADLEQ